MSSNVLPFGSRTRGGPASPPAGPLGELVSIVPRRRPSDLPETVWADVDSAARRWDELRDQGREVRFELPADGGRVTATLRALDGGAARPLALRDVVGPGDDWPAPAA